MEFREMEFAATASVTLQRLLESFIEVMLKRYIKESGEKKVGWHVCEIVLVSGLYGLIENVCKHMKWDVDECVRNLAKNIITCHEASVELKKEDKDGKETD